MNDMNDLATKFSLNGLEKIKKIHLTLDQFTIENGMLTSTLKIKRFNARQMYK